MPLQQLRKQRKYVEVTIPAIPSLLSVPFVTALILTLESPASPVGSLSLLSLASNIKGWIRQIFYCNLIPVIGGRVEHNFLTCESTITECGCCKLWEQWKGSSYTLSKINSKSSVCWNQGIYERTWPPCISVLLWPGSEHRTCLFLYCTFCHILYYHMIFILIGI